MSSIIFPGELDLLGSESVLSGVFQSAGPTAQFLEPYSRGPEWKKRVKHSR